MRSGAAGGGRQGPTGSPAIEGVEARRGEDPVVPADVLERDVEGLAAALGHSRAAHGSHIALLPPDTIRSL